jgi:Arc/MetJ-type ribon-helix-helix transcriptional regulator
MDNTTVKIDKSLLARIEKIVKDKFLCVRYANKKQFVNIAVLDLLEKSEEELVENQKREKIEKDK